MNAANIPLHCIGLAADIFLGRIFHLEPIPKKFRIRLNQEKRLDRSSFISFEPLGALISAIALLLAGNALLNDDVVRANNSSLAGKDKILAAFRFGASPDKIILGKSILGLNNNLLLN